MKNNNSGVSRLGVAPVGAPYARGCMVTPVSNTFIPTTLHPEVEEESGTGFTHSSRQRSQVANLASYQVQFTAEL